MTSLRFARGWRALPREARRAWLRWIGLGLATSWGVLLALTWWVRGLESAGRLAWESGFLAAVRASPLSFANALVVDALGSPVLLVPMVLVAAAGFTWRGRPLHALSVLGTFFLVYLTVQAGWLAWPRARPTLIADGVAAPGLNAFPSGHSAQALATWGFLAWLWVRASPSRVERILVPLAALVIVATVVLARLRLGTHWPSDVAAGLGVGALWIGILAAALGRAERAGGR